MFEKNLVQSSMNCWPIYIPPFLGSAFSSRSIFSCEFCTLFMRPTSLKFQQFFFKLGPIILLTHLKIILLQCFQFSTITYVWEKLGPKFNELLAYIHTPCLGSAFSSRSIFSCEFCVLFIGPTSLKFSNFFLKLGPMILFTHLKIILL